MTGGGVRSGFTLIELMAVLAILAILAAVLFLARPLSVLASTLGSEITWRERALLAWIMPRGIVAAAVAALFGLRLEEAGIAGGELLDLSDGQGPGPKGRAPRRPAGVGVGVVARAEAAPAL